MASPLPSLPCSPPFVSCRCSCTWSRSAGRGKTVPATVRTKAPTSTCATPYTTTCGRIHAPPPPAGSREAAAARCPYASTSVWRAQSERVALLYLADGSPLGRRPPDNAATVPRSRLLNHDLSAAATPELHSPATPVEVPHTPVMLTTRHVQRPREREAAVQARPLKRRRQRRRWRWTGTSALRTFGESPQTCH